MTTQNDALTRKQETFLLAYLTEPTLQAAATTAGISHDTAQRWLKLPHIQAALVDMRKQVLDAALDGLVRNVGKAIETLARHIDAEDTPASVQVRASQIMLEQSVEHGKMTELERKISELETLLKSQGKL